MEMRKRNIILCGFMGCGKSTVGALLAKKTGMSFIDLDAYIEKKEKMTISRIFADKGEEYFRELERQAVKELSEKNGMVIAAGGGTLTFQENVDVFRKTGRIILLDLPVEAISERLKDGHTGLRRRPAVWIQRFLSLPRRRSEKCIKIPLRALMQLSWSLIKMIWMKSPAQVLKHWQIWAWTIPNWKKASIY